MKKLRKGSKGLRVKALQRRLNRAEIVLDRRRRRVNLKVDGDFGDATERAVKLYERSHGLPADGIVGRAIARKLNLRRTYLRLRRQRAMARTGVVTRAEWGAQPPRGSIGGVVEPVHRYFLHCTVTGVMPKDATMAEEKAAMRNLQGIAFGRDFYDISYSFIVFPSGRIYEGRGWDKAGAHTEGYNSTAYATAAYIPCAGEAVSDALIASLVKVGRIGRRNGSVAGDVVVLGHRDVSAKSCPGQPIYNRKAHIQRSVRA